MTAATIAERLAHRITARNVDTADVFSQHCFKDTRNKFRMPAEVTEIYTNATRSVFKTKYVRVEYYPCISLPCCNADQKATTPPNS